MNSAAGLKLISEQDREGIHRGLARWRTAQFRAGVGPEAIVDLNDGSERVSLRNLDGLMDAYVRALPDQDADQTAAEWRHDAGVRMLIEHNGRRGTSVVAIDAAAACRPAGADFRLTEKGLRLRICDRPLEETYQKPTWLDPLSPAYTSRIDYSSELASLAGTAATVRLAKGGGWLAAPPPAAVVRYLGIVALPDLLTEDTGDFSDVWSYFGDPALVGVAHLLWLSKSGLGAEALVDRLTDQEWRFVETARTLATCDGDWSLLASLGQLKFQPSVMEFVVPGYVPSGELTLAVGAAGTGKSTMLHDLAILVATPEGERDPEQQWLGVSSKDIPHGTAVFLGGEDSAPLIAARRRQLRAGPKPGHLIEWCCRAKGEALTELLRPLKRLDGLKALIVDPARVFMDGSDSDDRHVDEFLVPLEDFAHDTGCAVIVAHHLKKDMSPASPSGVLGAIRGSQILVDRPRAIIGLTKRRDVLSAAVIKSNIPTAYPMNTDTRSFQMNATTLRVEPMADHVEKADKPVVLANKEVETVVAAIIQAHADGKVIMKTGKSGVFKLGLPGLEIMSRAVVLGAVDAAIAAGRLTMLPNRHIVPAAKAFPELPNGAIGQSGTGTPNTDI